MIDINGQFPGPTIRAKAGDTIVVELKNALHTEGIVIHWHDIRQVLSLSLSLCNRFLSFSVWVAERTLGFFEFQLGTPWADGTAAISQCAINPEETFVYRFKVDKVGLPISSSHV